MDIKAVKEHCEGALHKTNVKASRGNQSDNTFFDKKIKDQVTAAEVKITHFFVQHNLPLATAVHIGPLMRSCFPDSQIAKDYKCSATKTASIIKEAFHPSTIPA